MSQTHDKTLSVVCNGAYAQHLRLILNASGIAVLAGASDLSYGTLRNDSFASGDRRTLLLRNDCSTKIMVASGAISKNGTVYAAASGKVAATGTVVEGTALEAASADGDWIEVLPIPSSGLFTKPVIVDTDGATLTAGDSGSIITNTGATGAATFVLPAATVGLNFTFHVNAAYELRIDPSGTETIGLPSSGVQQAAGKYIGADAVGEWVNIVCIAAGKWTVQGYLGTWTVES